MTLNALQAENEALRAEVARLTTEMNAIVRNVTNARRSPSGPRWAHLKEVGLHGSTISAQMVRAAGLNPDEVTGWRGPSPCPLCGFEPNDELEPDDGGTP